MKRILAFLSLLLVVCSQASTIICTNVVTFTGANYNATSVQFSPVQQLAQPQNGYNGNTVIPAPQSTGITNSAFAINITQGGFYSGVFFPQNLYVQPVNILVPSNDTNTYTLNQVMAFAQTGWAVLYGVNPIFTNAAGITSVVFTNGNSAIYGSTLFENTNYDAFGAAQSATNDLQVRLVGGGVTVGNAAIAANVSTNANLTVQQWNVYTTNNVNGSIGVIQNNSGTSLNLSGYNTNGTVGFRIQSKDGSGYFANGNLSWDSTGTFLTGSFPYANLTGAPSIPTIPANLATTNGNNAWSGANSYSQTPTVNGNPVLTNAPAVNPVTNQDNYLYAVNDAVAFCNSNGIADAPTRTRASKFVNCLQQYGIYTNAGFYDALILNPLYNPTNNRSLFGRPVTWTGGQNYTSWGARLFLTNGFSFALPNLTNWTVVIVKRDALNLQGQSGQQNFDWGLDDGGSNSMCVSFGTYFNQIPMFQSGTNWTLTKNLNNAGGQGAVMATLKNTDKMVFNAGLRHVQCVAFDGTNLWQWQNTVQGCYRNSGNFPYTPNVIMSNSVANFRAGYSTNWFYSGVSGTTVTNGQEEVFAVLFYNTAALTNGVTTNIWQRTYTALRYLDPSLRDYIFEGDSMLAYNESDLSGVDYYTAGYETTSAIPYLVSQKLPAENCFQDWSQGGATINSTLTNGTTQQPFPKTMFTLLPPEYQQSAVIISDLGRNDTLSSSPNPNAYKNWHTYFDPIIQLGVSYWNLETAPTGTNYPTSMSLWNTIGASNLYAWNWQQQNNPYVSRSIPMYAFFDEYRYSPTNGFTMDSVHMHGVNEYIINGQVAQAIVDSAYVPRYLTRSGVAQVTSATTTTITIMPPFDSTNFFFSATLNGLTNAVTSLNTNAVSITFPTYTGAVFWNATKYQ